MKIIKKLYISVILCIFSAQAFAHNSNIILFGFPGAGKGTLSQKLTEKYHYAHICPGNLLRAEIRYQSDFGKKVEPFVIKGEYAPDQIIFDFLKKKIMEAYNKNLPIIFDGYPKSMGALKLLDSLLEDLSIKENTIVLHLKIDKEKLLNRVLNRVVCNRCHEVYTKQQAHCNKCKTRLEKRPQDTAEILKRRIDHHLQIATPLLQSLRNRGYQVTEIEADSDSKEIFKYACRLIDSHSRREQLLKQELSKKNSR